MVAVSDLQAKRRKLNRRERWLVFERTDGLCAICFAVLDFNNWDADHIIAFKKTGRTDYIEMQATCPSCNRSKGIKDGLRPKDIYTCYGLE